MAKQLNVNLAMTADTSKAKQALQELNQSLSKLMEKRTVAVDDKSIQSAKQAAIDLQHHLNAAVNTDTGKLDLSKFSQSLTKSGQSLKGLYNDLSKIGPEGQSAFLSLAKSINQADSSVINLGSRLSGMLTTLGNTVRWQLSSSLLHGFMGALQGAYGYAQDLNESLNNIRIVTGQSVDDMARFADQANKAARQLSTTTTAYTDAALIYYQQGLSDEAVKARTDVTIKLANVSRQSAEEVSSQMTAIWNNFDDGSKSMEYYADVITALGAATASSSDEIAQGLQKFASVADTVGLSYEKATAALATVVAETRQSAEVVGTAFRTMFARFQGLQLGETLDDGVTLNKYSAALATIGVNILDANGKLKDMDSILDETAEKWNTIDEAQQVALAETVAGTRQYAQFMAIMNNYDKVLANQGIASGSEGTLQQQANIFAEGWEAAGKRVKAAAQGIYQDLLDDEFFIKLLNGFEKFLIGINNVIDGLGGLKGLLTLIGSLILSYYAKEIPKVMNNLISNFDVLTGKAEKNRQIMLAQNQEILNQMNPGSSNALQAQITGMKQVSDLTLQLAQNRKYLSDAEIQNIENKIRETEQYSNSAKAIGEEVDQLRQEAKELELLTSRDLNLNKSLTKSVMSGIDKRDYEDQTAIRAAAFKTGAAMGGKSYADVTGKDILNTYKNIVEQASKINSLLGSIESKTELWKNKLLQAGSDQGAINSVTQEINQYLDAAEQAGVSTDSIQRVRDALISLQQGTGSVKAVTEALSELQSDDSLYDLDAKIETLRNGLIALGADSTTLEVFEDKLKKGAAAEEAFTAAMQQMGHTADVSMSHTMMLSEAIGRLSGLMMQLSMAINGIVRIKDIWSNEDLSAGEKMLQTMSSLAMILPVISNLLNAQKLAEMGAAAARLFGIQAIVGQTAAEGASIPIKLASGAAGWVALGPLLALVAIAGAVVTAFVLIDRAERKRLQNLQETADKAKEASDKIKEETKANNELVESYKEALKLYEENSGSKESLEEIALKTAEAYGIENAELLIQQGRYKELTRLIEEYQQAQQKSNLTAAHTSVEAQFNLAKGLLGKDTGGYYNESNNSVLFGALNTDHEISQLINKQNYKNFSATQGGSILLSGLNDAASFVQGYEEISDAIIQLEAANLTKDNAIYDNLISWQKALKDTYDALKSLVTEEEQLQINVATNPLINDASINNIEEYKQLLSEVKEKLKETFPEKSAKDIEKIAIAQLKLSDNTKAYANTYELIQQKARELKRPDLEIQQLYEQYGDLVFSLKPYYSRKELDDQLQEMQNTLDQEALQVKITTYQSAQKDWKENMTVDEIKAFFETYENLFASEQEKIDFLNKTFIEQQKMLFEGEASNTAGLYNSQELSGLDAEYARIAQTQIAQKALDSASTLHQASAAIGELSNLGVKSSDALISKVKELAKGYDDCASELTDYEYALEHYEKGSQGAIDAQNKLIKALQQAEINKTADNVAKLTENLEELTDVEKQDVFARVGKELETVFGHGEKLTSDFVQKNWDTINTFLNTVGTESEKAANEIYEQLTTAEERYEEAVAQARAGNKEVEFTATINDEDFTFKWGDILDRFNQLDGAQAILNAFLEGKADINQILACFAQIKTEGQTVADLLASIGNTDLTAVVEQKAKILSNISTLEKQSASATSASDVESYVAQLESLQRQLDALNGTKIKVKGTVPKVGRANMSSTGGGGKSSGGGGGSSAKHTTKDAKAAAEEQDRYHEIKEVISDLTRAIDNLSKAKDRAFGKSRIQFIEQETAALNKQREAQEKYIDEIKQNLSLDKGAAMAGVGYAGVGIAFDSENRISNYNEILAAAVNKYNQDVAWWNGLSAEAQQDEANQAKWEGIEEAYANVKDSMNQYEETLNLLEDAYDEAQDLFYQWQDLNAEKLNYEIEVKIKLNDADLKQLQLISKVLGDSLYKIPEVMQNLFTINGESQYQRFLQGAADYKQFWEDAQAAYAAGEISQAAFIEMLEQARDGIQSEIEALLQMNEQMREFYSQTLQKALKEIQNITDQMAHQASVIEHLKNLLSLSGREKDYAALNTLLEGATKIAENAWQTSKAQFEMFQENAEHAKEVYADILRTSEEGARQYKEAVLDPAIEQARAAEEQMYKDAEDFLNKANALFENSLKKAQADAEEYLTDGLGWDYLADSMDRAQAIQDEYLTKTNQIYETNDLLRKLSQDIDKADSTMAKNKLKNFADEIQAMQDQEKLSQTDLAIAKARYELLLAQIALEDAQNAKSTVRLQRDNEGNYGYVYTADMDAISDAQSAVADRQNDLYNLALQQANDYAAKILETEQQKNEALIALAEEYHNDASMSEEEYQRKRAEIIQQYDDLLYAQRDSYYKAIGLLDDVAVTNHNEAWTSDYEDLIDKGTQYTEDTTGFIDEIDEAIRLSNEARALVVADAELGLDSLDEKTRTLTEANDELARELMDNVLPSVDSVLDEVDSLTDAWARHYDEIMTTIQGYMQLIATMNEVMRVEAQRDAQMSSRSTDVPATMPAAGSSGAASGSSGGSGGGSGGGAGGSGSGDLHTYTVRAVGDINYSNGSYQTLINTTNASAAYETYSTACGSGRYSLVELLKDGQRQQMWTSSSAGGSWSNTTGQKNAPYAYASGGYTGAWSDGGIQDGKLAILHQKELVLNEDDTENFLAAIKIVRQISDVIGQRAAYQGGASGLSSPFFNSSNSMLEQQVTIHAEFPNATSHSEIEEAFDNLINRASQYAGRPTVMPRKFATI